MDRFIPKSHKIYAGLVKFGLQRMYKSTGADLIGFRPQAGGGIKPDPMQVQHDIGPADEDKYKAKSDGQLFDLGTEAVTGEYLGKTPVGFFVGDPPRQVSLLESRIRDVVDLEQYDELYSNPDIHMTEVIVNDEAALADGGQVAAETNDVHQRTLDVSKSQLPDDAILDLSSGADGARVSWRRVNDILHEKVSTEEMQMQEERGLIAGKSDEQMKKLMKWVLIAFVAMAAIYVMGPSAVDYIFGGGGGGGGGGVVPILLAPLF